MRALAVLFVLLALAGCGQQVPPTLPPSAELAPPRGYELARTIIHLHSPFSHDACDNKGLVAGQLNEACLADLRAGLCALRIDFAMLTDHPAFMADFELADLLLARGNDEIDSGPEGPIANRMACPNGHRTTLSVGYEDELMPVGMRRHLDPDPVLRNVLYNGNSPALVARLQAESAAAVVVAHTESRSLETLRALRPDAMEIFNIHAIFDPDIRQNHLGLDPAGGIVALLPFLLSPTTSPHPDLAGLVLFRLNDNYFRKWTALTREGLRVTGVTGSDAHQNVLPMVGIDGERVESYRRLMRFASNHLLVSQPGIEGVKEAIRAGRNFVVAEGIGSPVGMDFRAEVSGAVVGMGESGTFVRGATTIHVPLPSLHPASPQAGPASTWTIRLYRVGTNELDDLVATSVDAPLAYPADQPGSYRAEIHVVPRHLLPWLGPDPAPYLVEAPWILTNYLHLEAAPADADGDGVGDATDNCASVANVDQTDTGGLGSGSGPDGIGDACQCGDVNDDGRVTLADAMVIQRALLSPPAASMDRPERCDVGGSIGCSLADAVIVQRALLTAPTAGVQPVCAPGIP